MNERHGERPDSPADRPAPTITSKARTDVLLTVKPTANQRGGVRSVDRPAPTLAFGHNAAGWEWVVKTGQNSQMGGGKTKPYVRGADRPAPTLTAQTGEFWQWERPATTVCADPRIPAPGYRTGSERSLTPAIPAEQAAAGDQDGTEAIKLTVEEALILQGCEPDFPVQGSRTKKFEQIGNMIPPPWAAAILRQFVTDAEG